MVSPVANSLNAALLTGASVGVPLPAGTKPSQTSQMASNLSGITGSSLIAASLAGNLDIQSLVTAATGTPLSDETLAAINKAIEENPYSSAMFQTSMSGSLFESLSANTSSLYSATLNLLTNAYAPKLPANYEPVDETA